jgi:hypothetical protein
LLGNLPGGQMLASLVSNLAISIVRIVFYLVAKRGTAALDEAAAVTSVVGHPLRFARARRRRARGRRGAYSRVKTDLPPGRSLRRMVEFIALVLSRSAKQGQGAGRSAIDDPTDDDSLLTDSGFLQRFVTRPGVLLTFALIIVTAVAERSLIGGGPLGGGALSPAWEGATQLWGEVLQAFHPAGVGSASAAPPYAGFVALLSTVLAGKPWLAVDVLLLGSVPLAGLTALLALRRVTRSVPVRVWAAASYALLPVAFGAIAAGRLGSAVVFALIPLIGLLAARMFSEAPRLARRAAWATGLGVTAGTAFVPGLWPMAVAAAVIAAITVRRPGPALLLNLGIVVATPPLLLLPWMLQLLAHPSSLLLEAGVQQPGLATARLPARSLLLLSPGGPGLPPYWVSAALVLTALAALFAARQRILIVSGWTVALLGLGTAVAASRMTVTPAGGQAMTPWPGPGLAVAAAGLLLAAAAGADGLRRTRPARGRQRRPLEGLSGLAVAVLGLIAVSAPLLAAGYWLLNGVSGPVSRTSGEIVPVLVTPSGGAGRQLRTLVLSSSGGHVSYLLLRGGSPELTDSGLVPVPEAQAALNTAVGALVAPDGGEAADQSQLLARFDIGFVLMRAPLSARLASVLNGVAGLTAVSVTQSFDLWRLTAAPARVSVVEPDGTVVAISSGAVGVPGAAAPAAGGTLELAEPAGGWHAALDGRALTAIPSPAGSWAQAFRLPPGGGTLTIGRNGVFHDLVVTLELLAFAVVAALALPGVRTAAEIEAAAAAGASQAQMPEDQAEAEPGEAADVPDAVPGKPRQRARPARAGRAGRGRAPAARRQGRDGRRSPQPQPDEEQAAEPRSPRPAVGRPVRAGRRKTAPGLTAGGKAAATSARSGLSGLSGLSGAAAPGAAAPGAAGAAAAGAAASAGAAGSGAARAAWPAGQPASRFMSGPPEPGPYRPEGRSPDRGSGGRYDQYRSDSVGAGADYGTRNGYDTGSGYDTGGRDTGSGYDTGGRDTGSGYDAGRGYDTGGYDREPGRGRRSPSGAQYDDPPSAGQTGQWPPYEAPARSPGPRSPSGSPYPDETLAPNAPAADWSGPGRQLPGRRPDSDWQDSGWRDVPPAAGRGQAAGQDWAQAPQDASAWPADDQPSWRPDDGGSGWPQPRQQQGRPPDQQPGRPHEYRQGYMEGPPSEEPGWSVPGRAGWPDQGDALEALPPVAEVHHDWPGRADRSHRGWIAPEDEPDGDS